VVLRGPYGVLLGLDRADVLLAGKVVVIGEHVEELIQGFILAELLAVDAAPVVEVYHVALLQEVPHAVRDVSEQL